MIDLAGRTVLVTGASRGIGRHIALAFAREGTRLSLLARSSIEALGDVANDARDFGAEVLTIGADVSDETQVQGAFDETLQRFGSIDVLVNNAGITKPGLIHDLSESAWDEVMDTNLKGVFLCSRAAIRPMIKQGGGHIISISSLAAIKGLRGEATYAASKIGIIPLMQTIAAEYGTKNIRANSVMPGFHITAMTRILSDKIVESAISQNVLGRTPTLDEVCAFIVFLAGTEHISGQTFNLDSRIKREF
jgi:3-oxoacyl-[acyl-carrier protein] reductase